MQQVQQSIGAADANIVFMGIGSHQNLFFSLLTKQGYIPSDVSNIYVTLSTSSTNSVSFAITKGRDFQGFNGFGESDRSSASAANKFIKANHKKRIFVEMTYIC